VSKKYIQNYAMVTKPMTDLLKGKATVFTWGELQQTAFDFVRDRLLRGVHLALPDCSLPFHLATDASEDGKGAELYQLPTIPVDKQYPYCAQMHAPELFARCDLVPVEGLQRNRTHKAPVLFRRRFLAVGHP
jgi:hypothetical protein